MSEKPIIMSAWSVEAILADRKTATRRVDKPGAIRYEVGQRLWVREALRRTTSMARAGGDDVTCYVADSHILYLAGEALPVRWRWQRDNLPSIFMPKEAARIWLEVTAVRAERLQEITPEDVEAEGVDVASKLPVILNPRTTQEEIGKLCKLIADRLFKELWDSLNAKRGYGWDTNLMVRVVEFKRVKA